jgi:hypothetical protein
MANSGLISMILNSTIVRVPLFRLLAINLAIGLSIAALLVAGLLWLDPGGLRHLILADRSPAVALGLLIFGFVVTFGSTAMGTAIMAIGQREKSDHPRGGTGEAVPVGVRSKHS